MRQLLTLTTLLLTTTALRADQEVNAAVTRGAEFLKGEYRNAEATANSQRLGKVCLVGMALLESGESPDSEVLTAISSAVRERCIDEVQTYDVSLALMFLDRLGAKNDVPLIQLLGVRLLAGQNTKGGWSYGTTMRPNQEESRFLKNLFLKDAQLKSRPGTVKPAPRPVPVVRPVVPSRFDRPEGKEGKAVAKLHNEVERYAQRLNNRQRGPRRGGDDNSNTQFGIMGLWVARKHGVPVKEAFTALDTRFRTTQDPNRGGWNYNARRGNSTEAMTCAGLLGLAVNYGFREAQMKTEPVVKPVGEKAAPVKDQVVDDGLRCLGKYLKDAEQRRNNALARNLYFVWSLERVGVVYGLDTIGDVDWYDWGVAPLLANQNENGSWRDSHGADVGTSFALLFLARSNFTRDLTASLKGKFRDPDSASLKSVDPADLARRFPNQNPGGVPKEPTTEPGNAGVKPKPATVEGWERQVTELSESLVKASGQDREAMLIKLRDEKGSENTAALARAASELTGDGQRQAREALASRLTRMTASTLRRMMAGDDREIRNAAVVACGAKGRKEHVPDLISLLGGRDAELVETARESLERLTGKDFGPKPGAGPVAVAGAIADWQIWWKANQ